MLRIQDLGLGVKGSRVPDLGVQDFGRRFSGSAWRTCSLLEGGGYHKLSHIKAPVIPIVELLTTAP